MLNRPRGPASTRPVCVVFFVFFFRDTLPPPRLANGREDKLHLNDVIISDAASCNQGRGAGSGIRREVLYAWVGRQAEPGCGAFICLLSPSVLREKKRKTRRRRRGTGGGEGGTQREVRGESEAHKQRATTHTHKKRKADDNEGTVFWPPEICVSAVNENFVRVGKWKFFFFIRSFLSVCGRSEVGIYFRS